MILCKGTQFLSINLIEKEFILLPDFLRNFAKKNKQYKTYKIYKTYKTYMTYTIYKTIMTQNDEMWRWVEANVKADPDALRLKFHGRPAGDFDTEEAVRQIECRQRFGKKLAMTLAGNPRFFFPTALSGEQCTSDALAAVHAAMVPEGAKMVDLTAGLGIDAMHCRRRAGEITAVERDPCVARALAFNSDDIDVVCADCRDFVSDWEGETFDVAFIDPARRGDGGARVYGIADCSPDVTAMLPDIRRIARRLIIKLSPMLDVASVCASLPETACVTALGTPTECKELVVDIVFGDAPGQPQLRALTAGVSEFCFTKAEEQAAGLALAAPAPGMWLYEPYPAVMKMQPFALLSQRFGASAIAGNTHIYICNDIIADFPGTRRCIEAVVPFASKNIKRLAAQYPRLDVAVRNFPFTAEALARKLRVRQGGDRRLIGVTDAQGQPLMIIAAPE